MRSIVTCMTSDHNKSIINNRSLNAFCCSSFHDLATIHPFVHSVSQYDHTSYAFIVSLIHQGLSNLARVFRTHWTSRWIKCFLSILVRSAICNFVEIGKASRNYVANLRLKWDDLPNFDKKEIKIKRTTAVQRRARSKDPV